MFRNSTEVYDAGWLDIVFNSRNKAYGAYVLRKESGSNLTKALLIGVSFFTALFVVSFIYSQFNKAPIIPDEPAMKIVEVTYLADPVKPLEPAKPKSAEKPVKLKTEKFVSNIQVVKTPVETEIPKLADLENVAIGSVTQDGEAATPNTVAVVTETGGTGSVETPAVDNQIYDQSIIQSYPEFEGGMAGWIKYMQKNLRYPDAAADKGTQGKVYMSFVVEKDGSITDVRVVKGIGNGCDEEAMRVIMRSPKWKAGIQNNIPVRVRYNMPINFTLQ